MTYVPADNRYEHMVYRRSGRSGLQLPGISLGLWQNFGDDRPLETSRAIVRRAFDLGITHFDLANNYGPPYGSAEENFGRLLREDLGPYRDELIISSKAGYDMWPGPYGEWGSRKYLLASLDQSLAAHGPRLRRHLLLAPLRSRDAARGDDGRARHARCDRARRSTSASRPTPPRRPREAHGDPARPRHTARHPPAVVLDAQPLDRAGAARRARRARHRLHRLLAARPGACSPTSTSTGFPAARGRRDRSLAPSCIDEQALAKIRGPERDRGRARPDARAMALAWTLRDPRVTSTLVGASSVEQLEANVAALEKLDFTDGRARRDRPLRDRGRHQSLGCFQP